MMRLLFSAVFTIAACMVNSPVVTAEVDPHPLKPADTSSPRATLNSFSENMNAMYALIKDQGRSADASQLSIFKMRAIRCLDLSEIDSSAAEDLGERRAVLLTEILDRIELPPLDTIPEVDEVSQKGIARWRIPGTEITIVKIGEGPREGEYVFSTDTVSRIPEFYDRARNLPYRQGTVLEDAFDQLFTQAPPVATHANPLEPADTGSPQATMRTFIDNLNAVYRSFKAHGVSPQSVAERQDSLSRAIRCLNLSDVPPSMADKTAKETAVLLMEVFDRIDIPVSEEMPGTKQVGAAKLGSWTVPSTEIKIAQVAEGPRQGEFLFTSETVGRVEEFYERVKHLPYKDTTVLPNAYHVYLQAPGRLLPISWVLSMPDWLTEIAFGQPTWKWIAIIVVLTLLLVGLVLAFRFANRKSDDDPQSPFWRRAVFPISAFSLALLADVAISQINVLKEIVFLTSISISLIFSLSVLWLVIQISNAVAERVVASPRVNSGSVDAQMVRIVFRLANLGVFVVIVLYTAQTLGIPLTPVLAGLGVGGVAVALATQNSIENLIGGVNLFSDRPIRVGDFCGFGGRLGTVEEIGIRSTRVRSMDDTVIAIPNSTFSKMELENFSKREKILYHPRIQLAKDVTPDQIRFVLIEVRKMLYSHPKVDPDPARIRFAEFGEYSIDLDVFAYVTTSDFGEFLGVAEDLNLQIMDILSKAGTSLAVPIQRTLIEPAVREDTDAVQKTEKRVQQLRENNQL